MLFKDRLIFNSGKALVISLPSVITSNYNLEKGNKIDLELDTDTDRLYIELKSKETE